MTDVLSRVVARLRERASASTLDRVTVGEEVLLVELAGPDGTTAGLAHRPAGPPPATEGPTVESLLTAADGSTTAAARPGRALGIATANALSAPLVDWRPGDPMALLDDDVERIATVGLFAPAFRKFDGVTVSVVERESVDDVAAPDGVDVRTFVPDEADAALANAEVVFVTGSAFVYGGVDRYLDAAPAAATVAVVGATASFLPGPLFDAGVDVVAGAAVRDVARVRDAVQRGACGTDLHDAGVEKVYAAVERPPGVRLDATGDTEVTDT
ncbi:Rossmann-like domain-containing protein [Halosimplex amylolyticum]|uniref:Rossmann-like domain-containing protein n=1 Tax=Halosimplex amylolyticum TaxID=3396616 RepID=UPI003F552EFF